MKQVIPFVLIVFSLSGYGQTRKNNFPIWTFHQKNVNIHGISLGLATGYGETRNTNTNGVKVELIGIGIFIPLISQSPVALNDSTFATMMSEPISERINGLSLSLSGSACDCHINGISGGFVGQINRKVNGISASTFMNFTQVTNGIQMAMFTESFTLTGLQLGMVNQTRHMKGVQVGVFNRSKKLKGIQLGLWNVNEKRKMPILNWSLKNLPASDGTWNKASFEKDERLQDSIQSVTDSIRADKIKERQEFIHFKLEAGVQVPIGNLKQLIGVSPSFGFWVERPISIKKEKTTLALGLSAFATQPVREFDYFLPDTTFKVRAKGFGGVLGFQGAHYFEWKHNPMINHIEIHGGVGFGFLQTDEIKSRNKEGDAVYYYVETVHVSGGVTFRKIIKNGNIVGLNFRYNLAPPAWGAQNHVSRDLGGESFTISLQYRI